MLCLDPLKMLVLSLSLFLLYLVDLKKKKKNSAFSGVHAGLGQEGYFRVHLQEGRDARKFPGAALGLAAQSESAAGSTLGSRTRQPGWVEPQSLFCSVQAQWGWGALFLLRKLLVPL